MNIYHEQNVALKDESANKKKKIVLRVVQYLSAVLFAVGLLLLLLSIIDENGDFYSWQIILFAAAFPVGSGAMFFLSRRARLNINPEFDYLINGEKFVIFKITNKIKRKPFVRLELSNFEEIGLVTMPQLERHLGSKPKEIYACANVDETNYYLVARIDGAKTIIYFEPTQETLTLIGRALGKNIVLKK